MPRTYVRRNGERVRGDNRTRIPVPKWVDPYWFIQGSSIEKMVMTEFIRRGIWFEHTPQTNPLPWFGWMASDAKNPRQWEPDFLLPQYKIWIEIQGAYFHTLPGQMETDALRFSWIDAVGWKPIAWWEDDIRNRLQDLFNDVPEFYRVDKEFEAKQHASQPNSKKTWNEGSFYEGGDGIDHLAGLRKALRGRGRPEQYQAQRYRMGRKNKLRRPK